MEESLNQRADLLADCVNTIRTIGISDNFGITGRAAMLSKGLVAADSP
jgi:hypothetical protein